MSNLASGRPAGLRALRLLGVALLGLAVLALSAPPASATIYKWVDGEGNVGFTDDISNVPASCRDSVTSMSEGELARRVPIQRIMPANLDPIVIPGYAQSGMVNRAAQRDTSARQFRGFRNSSERWAYVPNLGYVQEATGHSPSDHTGTERSVYIDGQRFFLKNPVPTETDVNWHDKEVLEHVYGPEVRLPELDLYLGGHP